MIVKPLQLLIDADMVVFQACSAVEKEINWGDDMWTLHADATEAKQLVDAKIQSLVEKVLNHFDYTGAYDIILCFSGDNNFRYSVLSTYKSNRKGRRKPVCYKAIVEWCKENYETTTKDNLEADDCLGILATINEGNAVIISGDKDMKQIPGRFYDFSRDEFYNHSKEEADYWFFYQCLVGDATDGYSGCPGIGDKTAIKLLDAEGATWQTIVNTYAKKKISEDEALRQARVARILRKADYDFKTKQPILFNEREVK